MTTSKSKLLDSNRRSHAAKILAQASKKNQTNDQESGENFTASKENQETSFGKGDLFSSLNEQYQVIREDILKLREDLAHGYDLLKEVIDTRLSIKTFLRHGQTK